MVTVVIQDLVYLGTTYSSRPTRVSDVYYAMHRITGWWTNPPICFRIREPRNVNSDSSVSYSDRVCDDISSGTLGSISAGRTTEVTEHALVWGAYVVWIDRIEHRNFSDAEVTHVTYPSILARGTSTWEPVWGLRLVPTAMDQPFRGVEDAVLERGTTSSISVGIERTQRTTVCSMAKAVETDQISQEPVIYSSDHL